jgi:hypothetical protein
MSITSYQVDSVLKAYNKQNKVKATNHAVTDVQETGKQNDTVSLAREKNKPEVFDRISYSLLDIILKTNKSK